MTHKVGSAGICPYCHQPMVKHVIKEGARYHVHSYSGGRGGAIIHCSTKECEDNHGRGRCVPK